MFARRSDHDYNSFSDDEDRAAFGNFDIGAETYNEVLRDVKHNDPETTYLNLNTYSEFTDEAWLRIGQLLKNNTHVRRLNISQCELESGLESLMVGGLLERETPLTSLCITGNQQVFYYEGCKILAKYLQTNKKIEDLDLDESDVTPDELRLIMPALDGSQIKDLNFSHGMLQDDSVYKQAAHNSGTTTPSWNGVLKIFEEIYLPELTHIMLNHCQGGGDLCKAVAHLLKKKDSKLTSVDLRSTICMVPVLIY